MKKKRPLLLARHRKARLEFAEKYKYWTVDDWKQLVYWPDETKINRLGLDGRAWVWKPDSALQDYHVQGTLSTATAA